MNKPLLLVILFCLSVLVILSPVIYVTVVCGDYQDMDVIIEKQRNAEGECLVGMVYGETNAEYMKIENTNYYHPKILVVGASRIMQFKDYFFNASFYNAGVSVKRFDTYSNFIENIDTHSMPEIIILDLDQSNFKSKLPEKKYNVSKIDYNLIEAMQLIPYRISGSLLKGELLSNIININHNNIGYTTVMLSSGFMKDGSYYYGSIYNKSLTPNDRFKDAYNEIQNKVRGFEPMSNITQISLNNLKNCLDLCYKNNVTVIGLIPPFPPSINDKISDNKDSYAYMYQICSTCSPLFAEYGYELYDYTDVKDLGIDDSYFVDGHHGGEVAYLKIIIDMINHGSILNNYTNIEYLYSLYESRTSNLIIYPYIGNN